MSAWKSWSLTLAWLALILVVVGYDAHLVTTPLGTQLGLTSLGGDFTMYFATARALRLDPHANIYALSTLRAAYEGGCGPLPTTTYPYQPLLAIVLVPLTFLPCSTALLAWWQFSFVLWGIVTFWLARDATKKYGPGRGLLVGILCVAYRPIWDGLAYGQIHLLTLFILVLASRLAARRRFNGAGGVAALGTALKYVPAFFVAYHLMRGRWRLAVATAVSGLALLVGELLIVGPRTLKGSIGGATADVATYSALHRHWLTGIPDGMWIARLMFAATCITIVVCTWRRWQVNDSIGEWWVLSSLLLVMPLAWYHYLTWLLPLFVAVFHAALDGTRDIPGGFSREAIARRLPLLGFALTLGFILVPGAGERAVGPALIGLWVLSGALYMISARPYGKNAERIPVLVGQASITGDVARDHI